MELYYLLDQVRNEIERKEQLLAEANWNLHIKNRMIEQCQDKDRLNFIRISNLESEKEVLLNRIENYINAMADLQREKRALEERNRASILSVLENNENIALDEVEIESLKVKEKYLRLQNKLINAANCLVPLFLCALALATVNPMRDFIIEHFKYNPDNQYFNNLFPFLLPIIELIISGYSATENREKIERIGLYFKIQNNEVEASLFDKKNATKRAKELVDKFYENMVKLKKGIKLKAQAEREVIRNTFFIPVGIIVLIMVSILLILEGEKASTVLPIILITGYIIVFLEFLYSLKLFKNSTKIDLFSEKHKEIIVETVNTPEDMKCKILILYMRRDRYNNYKKSYASAMHFFSFTGIVFTIFEGTFPEMLVRWFNLDLIIGEVKYLSIFFGSLAILMFFIDLFCSKNWNIEVDELTKYIELEFDSENYRELLNYYNKLKDKNRNNFYKKFLFNMDNARGRYIYNMDVFEDNQLNNANRCICKDNAFRETDRITNNYPRIFFFAVIVFFSSFSWLIWGELDSILNIPRILQNNLIIILGITIISILIPSVIINLKERTYKNWLS